MGAIHLLMDSIEETCILETHHQNGMMLRTFNVGGKMWFVANDLATVLEYGEARSLYPHIKHLAGCKKSAIDLHIPSRMLEYRTQLITVDAVHVVLTESRKINKNDIARWISSFAPVNDNYRQTDEVAHIRKLIIVFDGHRMVPEYDVLTSIKQYKIDLYFPEYKLAIECDRDHCYYEKDEEKERQLAIEFELGCTFIRFNPKDSDSIFRTMNTIHRHILEGPRYNIEDNEALELKMKVTDLLCQTCKQLLSIKSFYKDESDDPLIICRDCYDFQRGCLTHQCRICHTIKPVEAFGKNMSKEDGYNTGCRDCLNKQSSEAGLVKRGTRECISCHRLLGNRNYLKDQDECKACQKISGTKKCPDCGITKLQTEFTKEKDHVRAECKACRPLHRVDEKAKAKLKHMRHCDKCDLDKYEKEFYMDRDGWYSPTCEQCLKDATMRVCSTCHIIQVVDQFGLNPSEKDATRRTRICKKCTSEKHKLKHK